MSKEIEIGRIIGGAKQAEGMLRFTRTVGDDIVVVAKEHNKLSDAEKAQRAKARKEQRDKVNKHLANLRKKVAKQKAATRKNPSVENAKLFESYEEDYNQSMIEAGRRKQ